MFVKSMLVLVEDVFLDDVVVVDSQIASCQWIGDLLV